MQEFSEEYIDKGTEAGPKKGGDFDMDRKSRSRGLINYAECYDLLYQAGYAEAHEISHGISSGLAEVCSKLVGIDTVLDIGCAGGSLLRYFQQKEKQVTGIDCSAVAVQLAHDQGAHAITASATDLPFSDNSFDLVFSSETFEHLEPVHADAAISEACRVSKKYVAMQIATQIDRAHWKKIVGHDLHLSCFPILYWRDKFIKASKGTQIFGSGNRFIIEINLLG